MNIMDFVLNWIYWVESFFNRFNEKINIQNVLASWVTRWWKIGRLHWSLWINFWSCLRKWKYNRPANVELCSIYSSQRSNSEHSFSEQLDKESFLWVEVVYHLWTQHCIGGPINRSSSYKSFLPIKHLQSICDHHKIIFSGERSSELAVLPWQD